MQLSRFELFSGHASDICNPTPCAFADAFAAAGIDGFYYLMDVDRLPERRLAKLLAAAKVAGFAGVNITYPFKQEVIASPACIARLQPRSSRVTRRLKQF